MIRKVSVRIHYHQRSSLAALLSLILLTAVLLGTLAWGQRTAVASDSPAPLAATSGLRPQYYLTTSYYDGSQANTACDPGYRMASLWEVLDTTNLKYNTNRGITQGDSGQGPPAWNEGWVRTGYSSSTASTVGQGNCNVWSSSNGSYFGTSAYLPIDWAAGQDIHVWKVNTWSCNFTLPVWCVGNDAVYLPLILRNYQ